MKLIKTLTNTETRRAALVYDNRDWDEFIVKFYRDDEYQEDADAFEDTKSEAIATAQYFLTM